MLDAFRPLSLAAAIDPQPDSSEKRANNPRILIVFASDRNEPKLGLQQAMLRLCGKELDDRDVHVIEVVGDTVAGAKDYAGALRQRYGVPSTRFSVVLIGRNGGIKLRADDAVSLDLLAGTIDSMPRRQRDAQRKH